MQRRVRRRVVLGLTEVSGYWARLHRGLLDLGDIRCCWGGGPSIRPTRHRVRALVSRAGVDGRCLDDEPELRDLLLSGIG